MKLTTCVVLTTYNGIQYLEQLLDSLRLQSRPIDKVLIFDDGSKDKTVSYVEKYIERYALGSWSVNINTANKGWKCNFRDGIILADCDVIFPCDQDDIWNLQKVEIMTSVMEENPDILLLSSDYVPLYENGGKSVDDLSKVKAEQRLIKIEFDEKFAVHTRPGCVMAIKKTLVNKMKMVWSGEYAHDAFLWVAASLAEGNWILHEPLIQYRRHSNNASTGSHRTVKNQCLLMDMGKQITEYFLEETNQIPKKKSRILDNYLTWAKLRKELIVDHNIINFIRLIRYHKYYRSVRQEVGDLYYVFRNL